MPISSLRSHYYLIIWAGLHTGSHAAPSHTAVDAGAVGSYTAANREERKGGGMLRHGQLPPSRLCRRAEAGPRADEALEGVLHHPAEQELLGDRRDEVRAQRDAKGFNQSDGARERGRNLEPAL